MKLLLIDEDRASSGWLAERLESRGFVPRTTVSLEQAFREKLLDPVRAVIAGVGSSGPEGSVMTRRLRQAGFGQPLMILSARDDWRDAIESLDAGADDYLAKPVRSEEVAARLRAIIRRGAGTSTDKILLGDLELDLKGRCAWLSGKCLNLTRNEFRLLSLFLLDPNRVMTHREIHLQLYDQDVDISQNAIEVQIARLRRKVGRNRIRTIRGVGYGYFPHAPTQVVPEEEREPCRAASCNPCPEGQDAETCSLAPGDRGHPRSQSRFGSLSDWCAPS